MELPKVLSEEIDEKGKIIAWSKKSALQVPIYITFKDISLTITIKKKKQKTEKQILKDIFGFVAPGNLVAVMGPSGKCFNDQCFPELLLLQFSDLSKFFNFFQEVEKRHY